MVYSVRLSWQNLEVLSPVKTHGSLHACMAAAASSWSDAEVEWEEGHRIAITVSDVAEVCGHLYCHGSMHSLVRGNSSGLWHE